MPKGVPGEPAVTIYDPAEVAAIKAMRKRVGVGAEGTYLDRLAAGEVLWFPGHLRGKGRQSAMVKRGYSTKTRKAERDGVQGYYIWAEKKPTVGD